jgi:hypothetical protein
MLQFWLKCLFSITPLPGVCGVVDCLLIGRPLGVLLSERQEVLQWEYGEGRGRGHDVAAQVEIESKV